MELNGITNQIMMIQWIITYYPFGQGIFYTFRGWILGFFWRYSWSWDVLGYSPNKKMPVTSIITTIFFGIGPKKLHYPLELDGEISFIQKYLYNYVCIYTYTYIYIYIHVHISSMSTSWKPTFIVNLSG